MNFAELTHNSKSGNIETWCIECDTSQGVKPSYAFGIYMFATGPTELDIGYWLKHKARIASRETLISQSNYMFKFFAHSVSSIAMMTL